MKNQLLPVSILILTSGLAPAASSNETAIATLDSALQSKNPDIRKDAVKALGVLGSTQPYQARLESMLNDKDVQVRLAAVASLSESKDTPALQEALDDSTPEVRFAAAKALFTMNNPAGERALIRVLNRGGKTSSNYISQQKREALRTIQTPKPLLMISLRMGAAFAPVPYLGFGVSATEKAISSKVGASNRASTALMLGKAKDSEAVAALESALTDKAASVRAAAIQAIALTDDPALAQDAETLLNDKSRTVRLRAAVCYLRLSSIESDDAVESTEE
jgi:HEAT repeat protein